ncbi:Uncharacterised protein [Salmonella enterica subsp. enterica serovar Typhi]|nr:Uncharacterised protein [Salmonella enterica subsp. enterica serovar Typhi]
MTKFRVEAARGKLRPGFGKLMEITVQCIGARKDATYRAVRQYGFIFIFNRTAIFSRRIILCALRLRLP